MILNNYCLDGIFQDYFNVASFRFSSNILTYLFEVKMNGSFYIHSHKYVALMRSNYCMYFFYIHIS